MVGSYALTKESESAHPSRLGWERVSFGVDIHPQLNTIHIYIFITYARKTDQSDRSVGVDYLSIFHPNNLPLVLGMLVGCVATDTSSSN